MNSASMASCGARLNSSSTRHVSRTCSAARSAPRSRSRDASSRSSASLSRWIAAPSAPTATATRSRYQAAELLDLREQLLALGAARRALHLLLGVAGRQLEPGDARLLQVARLVRAVAGVAEHRRRRVARLERRVAVHRPRLLDQQLAALGRLRVEHPLEPVEPARRDAGESRALGVGQLGHAGVDTLAGSRAR